jgi:prepilin-type N-terminal cleavage/methylation domain-containing protein
MRSQRGFTLVELSIVLIIIGLLIGGILKGQELIRNAQSKALISQIDAFRAANNSFIDRYGQLPGDFSRASELLPAKSDGSSGQLDGDGNGRIGGLGNDGESLQYWQHLAAADLIGGIAGIAPVPGVGLPVGRIPGSVWNAVNAATPGGELCAACTLRGNYWRLGAPDENALTTIPLMTADEAYLLDLKIDDGRPTTGLMQAGEGAGPGGAPCVVDGDYNTAVAAGPACVLGFAF